MKILILTPDIYTRGGIARYTATLAAALGELIGPGNVHVLALLGGGSLGEIPKGFSVLRTVTERLTPAAKLRFAARAVIQARGGYDLIFCSHLALAPVAALARKLFGTPFWVAGHDVEVWERIARYKAAALKRASLVLPVSRFTAQMLCKNNGFSPDRVRVLYNAIPEDFAKLLMSENGSSSSRTPGARQGKYILSVGSLAKVHAYKGFDTVIRALPAILREVPDIRYLIVGSGDNQPSLESLASALSVRERVIFEGQITDGQLADAFHGCELFVMPSRAWTVNGRMYGEGFGRVYVEAALAGKAVVGSRGGGAAEAVVHGETGLLVNPASVVEVSGAVLRLLRKPGLGASMGMAGRRWASQMFTQGALREELRAMIGQDALSSPAAPLSARERANGSGAAWVRAPGKGPAGRAPTIRRQRANVEDSD